MTTEYDVRERDSIERDLTSTDEDVRRLAVERAAVLPAGESLHLLAHVLGDASWRVRKAAVERLVALGDGAAVVRALVAALADGENPGRRNAAVEALVQCGGRAVPELLAATDTDDVDVRKLVVDALAGIADARSAPTLLQLLRDPDANVRAAAADALGGIGGEDVWGPLLALAIREDEETLVRFAALHALAALDVPAHAHELAPVLENPLLRAQGLALLGRRADDAEAVAVLLKGLTSNANSTRDAAMRSLLRLLSRLDGDAAAALTARVREACAAAPAVTAGAIDGLAAADLAAKLVMIQFLGLLRDERAVVPMLRAARDEALAEVALSTLAEMGEISEGAIDAAWSGLDALAHREACALFGRTRGERGAARLLSALEDPDPELRVAAIRAIGRRRLASALSALVRRLEIVAGEEDFESEEEVLALTGSLVAVAEPMPGQEPGVTDRAIELLHARLEGADETVRLAIAKVLGCIGRHEDVELLELLLKDPSALVRRAAVDALARIDPGTAAEPLRLALADESASVRIAAAAALGASQSDAVIDDLRRLASDEDPRVRAAAVRALGTRFGSSAHADRRESALGAVEAALGDEALVALGAVEALLEIGGEEASLVAGVLVRPEPELVKQAVVCLARHAATPALEALVPLVAHPDWTVRAEAIQALADRGVVRAVPPILRRLETEQDEFVRGVILRALKRLEG